MVSFDKYQIREIKLRDARAFFNLIENNRVQIARYFPFTMKGTKDLTSTSELIRERNLMAKKNYHYHFAISLKSNDRFIGCISLRELNNDVSRAEIGFFIDSKYTGKGIATKAVQAIVKYSFEVKNLNKLVMRIGVDNKASRRVAEKNGFRLEGILLSEYKTYHNEVVDIAYYGLLSGHKINSTTKKPKVAFVK